MYEIFGRGRYANLFLQKANELCNIQREAISGKKDNYNQLYLVGNLLFKNSSQYLYNYEINISDNTLTKTQLMSGSNLGFCKFPLAGSASLKNKTKINPFRKVLVVYETFKSYKDRMSANANYFIPYNLTGSIRNSSKFSTPWTYYGSLVYPFTNWDDEINSNKNYRINSAYDDYVLITGMSFYDDDNNIKSGRIVYGQDLDYTNLLMSRANGNWGRQFESITTPPYNNIPPYICPLNGLIPDTSGLGSGSFNFFAESLAPQPYLLGDYIFQYISAIESPFICMSLTTNNVASNSIQTNDSGFSPVSIRQMAGFVLAPTISDFAEYFSDWGLELYTSIDDLLQDIPEEGTDLPDIGYTPPEDSDGIPDNTVDDVTPLLPNVSPAVLSKTYCLKMNEYQDFNSWIASTDFLDALSKYFQDPMDGVLSLKLYPFDFLQHDSNYLTEESQITIINQSRDIHCYLFTRQYNFIFNGGSYTYSPYYGDFNDYLASYGLYIPFVGSINLDSSEVVGKTLKITYGLDILSGQCQVLIYSNNVLIRTLAGVCGMDIPLTGTNYTQSVRNAVNFAVGLATSAATGYMAGKAGLYTSVLNNNSLGPEESVERYRNGMNLIESQTQIGLGRGIPQGVQAIGSLIPSNASIEQTKTSPCTNLFAPQVPYLSIVLPQPIYPDNRQQLEGYNASMTRTIGSMEGYCKGTPYGDWDILGATVEEINMIKQIIQTGFYI